MRRLPVRLRLTLAFAAVMALVLAATGAFLYLRLEAALDRTIDDGLRARAGDLTAVVRTGSTALGPRDARDDDEGFAQLVDARGRVLGAGAAGAGEPLLTGEQLARVGPGGTFFVRRAPAGDERVRLLAVPAASDAATGDGRSYVVAGTSLDERDEALGGLLGQLSIALPLALALAALAGYGVGVAALRPVESMRRRAAAISGAEPGARLPVSPARDELRRLAETLNDMLARLEQALARERSFVADASHELRTPLALLKTELELALRRPRSREELERALRSAADETDRLAQLAEDLLVLARSDRGRLPVRSETVRVRDVLDGVGERFAPRGAHAGRPISVEAPAGLEVTGDRLRLEQALGNLVDNALRHGSGPIRLVGRVENGRVDLHVVDAGPGFPEELLPRAFERFARGDEARSGGGAGLGLAIVDVIAHAHLGSAQAANLPGAGADVWLSLPR